MTKRIFLSLIISVTFYRCVERDATQSVTQESCIPHIVTERNQDTLQLGETYRAKVYLSDSSYLYLQEGKRKRQVLPVFKINGALVESDEYYYIFRGNSASREY